MSEPPIIGDPWGEIDPLFYPFESNEPFKECTMCQISLLNDNAEYIIEKAIRGNDVIFEVAICMQCAQKMHSTLSKQSIQSINSFLQEKLNFENTLEMDKLISKKVEDYVKVCKVTGQPIDKSKEYQIYAQCVGNKMFWHTMPYALGPEAIEMLQELLSPETKEELDNFMGNFVIPPELRDILKNRPIIV